MFGRSDKGAERPAVPASGGLSFIAQGVVIAGSITEGGHLHIEGRVDGDINCTSLILGPDGGVTGNVTASEAKIGGEIKGAVSVTTLTVQASARINGDLAYQALTVESGARIEGQMKVQNASATELRLVSGD